MEELQQNTKKEMKDGAATEDELIKLRDIGLLSDTELEEVIELYETVKMNQENDEQYR